MQKRQAWSAVLVVLFSLQFRVQALEEGTCKKFSLPGDETSFYEFLSAFFEDNEGNSVSTTWCPNDEDLVTDDVNRLKIWMTTQLRTEQQERREISMKLTDNHLYNVKMNQVQGEMKTELQKVKAELEEVKKAEIKVKAELEEVKKVEIKLEAELEEAKKAEIKVKAELEEVKKVEIKVKAELEEAKKAEIKVKAELEEAKKAEIKVKAELEEVKKAEIKVKAELEEAKKAEIKVKAELEEAKKAEIKVKAELEEAKKAEIKVKAELEEAKKAEIKAREGREGVKSNLVDLTTIVQKMKEEVSKLSGDIDGQKTWMTSQLRNEQQEKREISKKLTDNHLYNVKMNQIQGEMKTELQKVRAGLEEVKKVEIKVKAELEEAKKAEIKAREGREGLKSNLVDLTTIVQKIKEEVFKRSGVLLCAKNTWTPFGCFKIIKNSATWEEARQHCVSLDMDLASFERVGSPDEMDGITKALGIISGNYWIGLKLDVPTGKWLWNSGGELSVKSKLWDSGEPGGAPEDTGVFRSGKFHDYVSHRNFPSICYKPLF